MEGLGQGHAEVDFADTRKPESLKLLYAISGDCERFFRTALLENNTRHERDHRPRVAWERAYHLACCACRLLRTGEIASAALDLGQNPVCQASEYGLARNDFTDKLGRFIKLVERSEHGEQAG